LEEDIIVTDRVAGPAKKMKCAVKQVAGKAIDDAKLEPDGKAGKIESEVQSYLAILDLMPGRRGVQFCLSPLRDLTRLRDSARR
jgi:uncharacterized protein YjbJ (UPF0337 family)